MHETTEGASHSSPRTPTEAEPDHQLQVPHDKPVGLKTIVYPSFTLYVRSASATQPLAPGSRYIEQEIQYVESEEGPFRVTTLDANPDYQNYVQTLSLVAGGLGKTARGMAEELKVPYPTLRTYRQDMLTNIGATTMRHALRLAFDTGRLASIPGEQYRGLIKITPHQLRILDAVSQGYTPEQTGQKFNISPATVKTHLQNIYAKDGLHDAAHAVMRACLSGQLPLEN